MTDVLIRRNDCVAAPAGCADAIGVTASDFASTKGVRHDG